MSKGTTVRKIRAEDDLWEGAGQVATDAGTDRSATIRDWLAVISTPGLLTRLTAHATATGQPVAAVITRAVTEHLDREDQQP